MIRTSTREVFQKKLLLIEEMGELEKPQICVKIMVYKDYHVDQVVYYRNKLPLQIVEKWKWYFEYLAARIKVVHPRRKVELSIGIQNLLQGEEYIQAKRASLLKAKKSQLKRLQNQPAKPDFFGFYKEQQDAKINRIRSEIQSLENGEFRYYVPPTYINTIKEWI